MNNLPGIKPGMLSKASYGLLLLGSLMFCGSVFAESVEYEDSVVVVANQDGGATSVLLPAEELKVLVAPIALYPDDLLGVVLPASTYPLQIVQAARYLEARKDGEASEPDGVWDDSIVALLNYPEVLDLLNSDLNWTWKLGEAVLSQHEEVITAIADFRELARLAGNLESDKHQTVEVLDGGAIEIRPTDPEVIYVPYYEPSQVTAYSSSSVYHYYPHAYPVYYYPYPANYVFSSSFFWGVTSAFTIGWNTHHLHVHHLGYDGHPYSGHRYSYDHHYYRRPVVSLSYYQNFNDHYNRDRHQHHTGNYWQPKHNRAGARPRIHDAVPAYTGGRTITQSTNHRDGLVRPRETPGKDRINQPQRMKRNERNERNDSWLARIEQGLGHEKKRTERQNHSFASSPKVQPQKAHRPQAAASKPKQSQEFGYQSSRAMKKHDATSKSFRARDMKEF